MYYTYVIKNPEGLLYKGSTNNLEDRIKQHNSSNLPGYTKNKGPWKCVYKEVFETRLEAEEREKFFKTGKGREFIKRRLNNKNKAE